MMFVGFNFKQASKQMSKFYVISAEEMLSKMYVALREEENTEDEPFIQSEEDYNNYRNKREGNNKTLAYQSLLNDMFARGYEFMYKSEWGYVFKNIQG